MDAQFKIIPKILRLATCQTWILPSSRWLGFLHLIIHVKYVKRQMMLIRCCFATIVMVDTISSASSRSSHKFPPTIGNVHHVLLQHLDSYSDHATLFLAQIWGEILRIYTFMTPYVTTLHVTTTIMPVHGLIHDGQLWACPCALLRLMYGLRRLYVVRYLGFQLVDDNIKGQALPFSL